ncbi:PepSY domain-containing protein [Gramella sp. GC03-9]|uniref:PepSY domain-containing protein n=1 Tax=Christiangramia oceanisediminis TaxID=2920386 RepID=A0A9X2R9J3_9FLAO|nr:PepSY-associated TM helix domain-containing protein [Gramella oceanisediminis]MCP9200858.1 PepSY domain-containing protein [Gramella oceanisediminis]
MKGRKKREQQAKILRIFRKVHRTTGALLFIFFFLISVSGVLLGWKKDSFGIILPETKEGSTSNLTDWLPLDSLHDKAVLVLRDSVSPDLSSSIDRIDVRKEKGSVKFIFEDHFYGIQLDGATGDVLSIGKRHSDLIENIHDASIIDNYLGTSGVIKVFYTTIMGIALLIFTVTGFWLWYGPKQMKKKR